MSKKQSNKKKRGKYQVTVLNDDFNTIDHVIFCLIEFCDHAPLQATQCANIIHTNGSCSVFVDTYEECKIVEEALVECKLSVHVTKYK
tara:strand:+ start:549 stop:812 length:264 start_codon:yes stop_codon:yes gene_type:complete